MNVWIDELRDLPRKDFYQELSRRMDCEIHAGYRIYPSNYVALDMLNGNSGQAEHYNAHDRHRFEKYLEGQMAKITLPDRDEPFLRQCILTMYANPLRNKLKTIDH